ncbi:carbonate dehydratase [Pseudomonas aeruginosa VRFPA09]|nr:carbonate dehydratase [Pseudomonas aeruginosa VRFPA09]
MSAPLPCYHCGLPVPAGSRFEARVLGETRAMCCPGCQAVAEAIVAGGLESYYRHRSENAANPEALPKALSEELQLYDRPDVQGGFVRHEGELAETSLMIEGISCAACGWLIEKHLRQLPGVAEARLNLSNHRLHVRWQDSQLPLSQLLGELRQIGYAGHPYQPDRATERLAMENRRALRQLGVAGLLWIQVMMAVMATWPEFNLDLSAGMDRILRWVSLILTTPIVFYCCGQFFRGALRDLRTRHLTMDVSVSLAIGGAYVAGIWSTITGQGELYFDAVGMFALFLLAGRYLERRARERTAASTAQLVNLLPASCLRLDAANQGERILLSELRVGDRVLVPPGAVLPADGVILDGQSSVDESLLTGEYLPHPRQAGDAVTGGTLNVEGPLTVEVGALGDDSRLLSGDASPMVASVAAELGIDEARGGLTPDDKLAMLERLHGEGRRVLMLGDGVNDVPVLAGADISVAMGSATDLAKTSADAVLLSNRLDSLVQAFRLARRTRHIIIENLAWASLYNGLVLPFAALGWITPGWAAIGMSVSSLLVVVNALRLTRIPSPRSVWPRSTS